MYVYIDIPQQHTKTEQYCLTLSTEEETTENYGIIRNM